MSGVGALSGRVVEFDPAVGLGVVAAAGGGSAGAGSAAAGSAGAGAGSAAAGFEAAGAGGASYPFHCTQIAGGSRTIEVGTEVTFSVVAGRLGRWEAAGVTPVATEAARS